jgi:hypothetical protein
MEKAGGIDYLSIYRLLIARDGEMLVYIELLDTIKQNAIIKLPDG